MATFKIYLEKADTDDKRMYLGILEAETMSKALNHAAEYFEYRQHDLVAVQVSNESPVRCPYCLQYHEAQYVERCPLKPKGQ